MRVSRKDFDMAVVPEQYPDTSYLEQEGWEERLAEYRRGDFDFVGVRAVVELRIPYGQDFILHTVESPGLWGIESDSGDDYFRLVFTEESDILADMLAELGVKVTE